MKWPLRNGGATYLRNITDTVQTVQYSDSQCTEEQNWQSVDVAVGYMQGSIVQHQDLLHSSCFIFLLLFKV